MSGEFILEFETTGIYEHPEQKWRMGVSKSDHAWLTETLGMRAKNQAKWEAGGGQWRYLGSQPIPMRIRSDNRSRTFKVRMLFRSKQQALLFKLARLGDI